MKLRKYVLVAATIVLAVSLVRPVYAHFIQELECRQVYFDLSAEQPAGGQVERAVGKGDRHLHIAAAPYPSYAGNVACLSAASARALQLAFGRDDIPFSVTWVRTMGLPNVTRDFSGFWELADRQARSRIFGGIHYQFDNDASQSACVKVTEFAFANYMRAR
jgi:hypothetical protein